jgi:hypothetical protein
MILEGPPVSQYAFHSSFEYLLPLNTTVTVGFTSLLRDARFCLVGLFSIFLPDPFSL